MADNFDSVWACVEQIPSWVQKHECVALWKLGTEQARMAKMFGKVPCAVDIGGARGRSSIVLSRSGMAVVTVSLWDDKDEGTQNEFIANARRCGCSGQIAMLRGNSNEVYKNVPLLNRQVDILFIDGGHDRQTVVNDIVGWGPKVRVGGYMIFHDVGQGSKFQGVNEAVAMLGTGAWGNQIGSWDSIGQVGTLAIFHRMA